MIESITQFLENITPQKVFQLIALITAPFVLVLGGTSLYSLLKNNGKPSSPEKGKKEDVTKKNKVHAAH